MTTTESVKDMISPERLEALKKAFSVYDKDGNGRISSSELRKTLQAMGDNPTEAEAKTMLNAVDKDENGYIDFEEFLQMMQPHFNKSFNPQKELEDAFTKLDRNKDGKITPDELIHYLTETGDEQLTIEEAEEFVREFDKNGDGAIDYKEFIQMIVT
ncbi:calmodulin-like [Lineus longissimus]|uniref:calmodulin-like n=1 Tax=Lineus longissimus TaxID=88925 RepID=UPI002B4F3FA4